MFSYFDHVFSLHTDISLFTVQIMLHITLFECFCRTDSGDGFQTYYLSFSEKYIFRLWLSIVIDIWFFMECFANTMTSQIFDYHESFGFDVIVYKKSEIIDTSASLHVFQSKIQGFFRCFYKSSSLRIFVVSSDDDRDSTIRQCSFIFYTSVDLENIPVFEYGFIRKPMHHTVIDR